MRVLKKYAVGSGSKQRVYDCLLPLPTVLRAANLAFTGILA
jgi:hypothetical protein